jgi:hypothetical protein
MNTKQLSELYTLHSMVNDPMTYEDFKDARAPTDPLAGLFNVLSRMVSKVRGGRAKFSETRMATGSAN